MLKKLIKGLILALTFQCFVVNASKTNTDIEPNFELGAIVYNERCVLCHGDSAMGEGLLPLKLKSYPNTNLIKGIKGKSRESIRNAVIYGGTEGNISKYMPPMGNDLTWVETESVIDFLLYLQTNKEKALKLIKDMASNSQMERKSRGRDLYESRCVLCHGKYGEGDGRMARVIKSPPPANLTLSRLPDDYLIKIISLGGEAMGRSPQMPPWGMQFADDEIQSIITYIKSIRRPVNE